jgi:hypothetical protein
MVGDYKWDVLCAKNAGIPCALLIDGDEEPDWVNGARYHIHRLTELIEIIRPDVYVKGREYEHNNDPRFALVTARARMVR